MKKHGNNYRWICTKGYNRVCLVSGLGSCGASNRFEVAGGRINE